MPVTARLSQKFYEKVGDEPTKELVEWLNQMDTALRAEFRELNELNAARLDARFTALESRLDVRLAAFEARLTRWLFVFWVGTLGTVIALMKL